jgi:predicted signal transduction protein with EAL and GGDEF domain
MGVVAEGVQTVEQLAHLKALGCEHGQGYFFSRPLAAHQVDSLIGEGLSDKRSASTETGLWPHPAHGEHCLYETIARIEAD